MRFLLSEGILQVKEIHALLVGHHHIGIIRNSFGNKMMSTNGFQPPDFLPVGKGNTIHFIGAVLFQKLSQAKDSFSCGMDIGEQQAYHILFSDASGNFFSSFFMEDDQRIRRQYQLITGNGFRSGNGDIGTIGACPCPDTLFS